MRTIPVLSGEQHFHDIITLISDTKKYKARFNEINSIRDEVNEQLAALTEKSAKIDQWERDQTRRETEVKDKLAIIITKEDDIKTAQESFQRERKISEEIITQRVAAVNERETENEQTDKRLARAIEELRVERDSILEASTQLNKDRDNFDTYEKRVREAVAG